MPDTFKFDYLSGYVYNLLQNLDMHLAMYEEKLPFTYIKPNLYKDKEPGMLPIQPTFPYLVILM